MQPLRNKIAIVTGASAPRGIGRAIAHRLAVDGAAVVVTDIDGAIEAGGDTRSRAANRRLAAAIGVSVEQMQAQRYAHVAVRDAGLPLDVANAVAYLAGPQANYVTGINLPVAGGVPFGI